MLLPTKDTTFTFRNSSLELNKGISYMKLNEKNYYEIGFVTGKLLILSQNKALTFFNNPVYKTIIDFLYNRTKKQFENIRIPQQFIDELRGYADATHIPFHRLLFMNFMYDIFKRYTIFCSGFSFFNPHGSLVVAHNSDAGHLTAWLELHYLKPLIMQVSLPNNISFVHIGFPLFVGALNGFNKNGMVINTYRVSLHTKVTKNTLATPLLMRLLLENTHTLKDAHKIVENNLTQSAINVKVTSKNEQKATVFEITSSDYAILPMQDNYFYCTNHHRTPEMLKKYKHRSQGSNQRLDSLINLVNNRKQVTVKEAIAIMQDTRNGLKRSDTGHSLTNEGTFQSFVFDMKQDTTDIYMSNADKLPVSLHGEYVKRTIKL